eukprot:1367759-Rhodomonas_salina.2
MHPTLFIRRVGQHVLTWRPRVRGWQEGSFFWQIVDLPSMVKMTGDTTGDVCNHARSKFIEKVSKVTLQEFMGQFNKIAAEVYQLDDSFYSDRGVKIHSLEVTSYRCADDSTARILQQIIQETTNRMNKLQQQESANEVALQQMAGEIEQEQSKGALIQARIANSEQVPALSDHAAALPFRQRFCVITRC